MWGRSMAWVRRNMPTRESMENNRLLRPVAHRVLAPELWRFTRRSVPRGVALGVVAGFLFPVAQIAIAAVFALPFRANVPVAALTTFITNPLTTPLLWLIAYRIGTFLLRSETPINTQPVAEAATGWLQWALSAFHWLWEQGPAFGLGLCVLTAGCAVVGYLASALGWRVWIARKWRNRRRSPAI
ncbi:membrane protein [Sphingomonas sanguinis]|uniref:Membrane protein n=3 Tax=Sphingomonas TaxID=13687 RepID=A0A147J3X7_9SPHN|nr:membrane protein [Sphingomonas sanguinis]KTW13059.1 membrane protein [Sphingomonas sanguinis]